MSKINTSFTLPKQSDEATTYDMLADDLTPASLWKKLWPDENYDNLVFAQDHFLLYEDGNFTPGNVYSSRDNSAKFSAGRYFVRDAEGYLRQMQVEHGENGIEYSVSRPLTNVEVPPAPSFLTKVFAFFGHQASKNLIQAYDAATAFASALTVLESNLTADINLHPPKEVLDAAANVIVEDAFEASNIREDSVENEHNDSLIEEENFLNSDNVFLRADSIPNINENSNKELSSDEKSGFFHDLAKASKFTVQNVQEELNDAFFDYQNYAQALSNLLIAQAAQLMLSVKNLNLNAAKPIFEGLQKSAEEFVYNTYNEEIREIANLKMVQGDDQLATQKSNALVDNVCRTGLNHLLTHMNKEEQNRNRNFEEVAQNIRQAMKENSSPSMFK